MLRAPPVSQKSVSSCEIGTHDSDFILKPQRHILDFYMLIQVTQATEFRVKIKSEVPIDSHVKKVHLYSRNNRVHSLLSVSF